MKFRSERSLISSISSLSPLAHGRSLPPQSCQMIPESSNPYRDGSQDEGVASVAPKSVHMDPSEWEHPKSSSPPTAHPQDSVPTVRPRLACAPAAASHR